MPAHNESEQGEMQRAMDVEIPKPEQEQVERKPGARKKERSLAYRISASLIILVMFTLFVFVVIFGVAIVACGQASNK
jgi:uncharacterized membrane protein